MKKLKSLWKEILLCLFSLLSGILVGAGFSNLVIAISAIPSGIIFAILWEEIK